MYSFTIKDENRKDIIFDNMKKLTLKVKDGYIIVRTNEIYEDRIVFRTTIVSIY